MSSFLFFALYLATTPIISVNLRYLAHDWLTADSTHRLKRKTKKELHVYELAKHWGIPQFMVYEL